MGHEPRVAFLSYSNFGNPEGSFLERIRDAVKMLDERDDVDFEYEGEMAPDVALNPALQKLYPFSRLTGPGQRAGHARPADRQHLGQAAAASWAATR